MRSLSGASVAVAAMLALAAVGCGKVGELKAKKAFKNANQAYQAQDYKKAADLYEEAVAADPNLNQAYFFLGNSYDNLYKPSKKGEPENEALLQKAVDDYQKASERLATSDKEDDKKLAKLALQYLVAAYGPDKLNDPSKAEPVVQRMIQLDPGDPTNYFALAKIYEDAGAYDAAEQMYTKGVQAKPNLADGYKQLAGFYNRQGEFDKTIDALQQGAAKDAQNPEGYFIIATYYWDDAQRNFRLSPDQKKDHVQKGLAAVDKALQLKPDYMEALVYKGLLLRLQANMEKDPAKQQALIKEAVALHDKAEEIRKKKAAGQD